VIAAVPEPSAVTPIVALIAAAVVSAALGLEWGVMVSYAMLLAFIALRIARRNGDPVLSALTTAVIGRVGLIIVRLRAHPAACLGAAPDAPSNNPLE